MLISRIELNMGNAKTRHAVVVPQVLHAAIEVCFPDKAEKDRKLWRIDRLRDSMYLLLLSAETPDFTEFARQFCSEGVTGETKDYTHLLNSIRDGASLRFRLRANPTHSVTRDNESRGKVYAHITVEQKLNWLIKKAQCCGFRLDERLFDVVETDYLRFWRSKTSPPVEIGVAVYEGLLEVADRELFIHALTHGIGRAKAYGCGLLTVASLP